jgi:hypothetical protein
MLRPGLQSAASFVEVRYQPYHPLEVLPSVIRVTGDNFRRSERRLTQIERVTEINKLTQVTKEGVSSGRRVAQTAAASGSTTVPFGSTTA